MIGWVVAVALLVLLAVACYKVEVAQREVTKMWAWYEDRHIEALHILQSLNTRRDKAAGLREAANRWDDPALRPELERLAREYYTPGGPSMPAIFMRLEADAIEYVSGNDEERIQTDEYDPD